MKSKMMVIGILALSISTAYAAQSFTGRSSAYGDATRNCDDIIDHPTEAEAERNAEKLAANFCDTFSMKEVRTSEFVFTSGCVTSGRGFAIMKREFKDATAEYRCH